MKTNDEELPVTPEDADTEDKKFKFLLFFILLIFYGLLVTDFCLLHNYICQRDHVCFCGLCKKYQADVHQPWQKAGELDGEESVKFSVKLYYNK